MNSIRSHISSFPIVQTTKQMLIVGLALSMSACASIGFGDTDVDADTMATSSIGSSQTFLAGIDPSDWQIMLQTVGELENKILAKQHQKIAWVNPKTGSKGEISDISSHQSIMDEECRSFKSSMHRVTGVENVAGEICKDTKGDWQMTGFSSGSAA